MDVYDPIIFLAEDDRTKLIDVNILLMAQSRAMASLSNIVGNLKQIDQMIVTERPQSEVFNRLLQLLRQVFPYHQAAILVSGSEGLAMSAYAGYKIAPQSVTGIQHSPVFRLMIQHRQTIYLSKAHQVRDWNGMESLGTPLAWLGVPLFSNDRNLGLLSISRDVEQTFTTDEMDTALAFVQRIVDQIIQDEFATRTRLSHESLAAINPKIHLPGKNISSLQMYAYSPGSL